MTRFPAAHSTNKVGFIQPPTYLCDSLKCKYYQYTANSELLLSTLSSLNSREEESAAMNKTCIKCVCVCVITGLSGTWNDLPDNTIVWIIDSTKEIRSSLYLGWKRSPILWSQWWWEKRQETIIRCFRIYRHHTPLPKSVCGIYSSKGHIFSWVQLPQARPSFVQCSTHKHNINTSLRHVWGGDVIVCVCL